MNNNQSKNFKTAIVLPVFNESRILESVLKSLLEQKNKLGFSIIAVNDGSEDKSLEILEANKRHLKILSYRKNRGKGFALRLGSDYAYKNKFEIIVWIDSDGQHNPKDIGKMLGELEHYDLVINRRLLRFNASSVSKIGRFIVRTFFNLIFRTKISDHLSGFRVFKTSIYRTVRWQTEDYQVEVEMLARAVLNNVKYKEIATPCGKKRYRGMSWRYGFKIMYCIAWCYVNKNKFIKNKKKK